MAADGLQPSNRQPPTADVNRCGGLAAQCPERFTSRGRLRQDSALSMGLHTYSLGPHSSYASSHRLGDRHSRDRNISRS
jgi:hypothetical protein